MPVQAQWDLNIPQSRVKCMDRQKTYVGASAVNVATDILLLIMPMPYVWNLHARLGQRLILCGIFLLGAFVSVISIVRLVVFTSLNLQDANITDSFADVMIWSNVEINVGLVCACLPSLRPAVQWLGLSKLFGPTRPHGSRPSGHITPSPYYGSGVDRTQQSAKKKGGFLSTLTGHLDDDEDSFQMIGQHHHVHGKTDTNVDAVRTSSDTEQDSHRGGLMAMPAIKVQRQWNISVDRRSDGPR